MRRALLVGCNYPGTNNSLRGCVNDVKNMKSLLMEDFGFEEDNFTVLIDTDDSYEQPTGGHIKANLSKLVKESQDGDILFFHFSGHGTQVPGDPDQDEPDAKDEAIVPTDMNLILDDDMRVILKELDPGVKFTMIADCCHSGGMLDHTQVEISGDKGGGGAASGDAIAQISSLVNPAMLASMFGTKDLPQQLTPALDEEQQDVVNRSMPVNSLLSILSQKTGGAVDVKSLRSSLVGLFGDQSSKSIQSYVQMTEKFLGSMGVSKDISRQAGGFLMQIIASCCAAPQTGKVEFTAPAPHAGQKPPSDEQLGEDKGILITGCQSFETSADACPSGDPNRAYGALSNAIQSAVKTRKEQGQLQNLTYRQVVTDVRELLKTTGFDQNPCLECNSDNANSKFILF